MLVQEVVEYLRCGPGGLYLDCTVGAGGHTEAILDASEPDGRVIGFDRDKMAIELAGKRLRRFGSRAILLHEDFRRMNTLLDDQGMTQVDGILFDLGVSSLQLSAPERGFSFQVDGPLDMRMDRRTETTASHIVNQFREDELVEGIRLYGEERWARRIARAIVRERKINPIGSTRELVEIVRRAVPPPARYKSLHPATRTFQALRIMVNQELEGLSEILQSATMRLAAGGRLIVISFHSLEDRIVKHSFRNMDQDGSVPIRILTKKPLRPEAQEIAMNPRSRSAKLRVIERKAA